MLCRAAVRNTHRRFRGPLRLRTLGACLKLAALPERCPSGLRSTPGKCVYVNSVPRVRIPPSPPTEAARALKPLAFLFDELLHRRPNRTPTGAPFGDSGPVCRRFPGTRDGSVMASPATVSNFRNARRSSKRRVSVTPDVGSISATIAPPVCAKAALYGLRAGVLLYWDLRVFATISSRTAGATGLTRWSSNPASSVWRRSPSRPHPVRATTARPLPHVCSRMRRQAP